MFLAAVFIYWLGVHDMVQIRSLLVPLIPVVLGCGSKRYSFWLYLFLWHNNYFKESERMFVSNESNLLFFGGLVSRSGDSSMRVLTY